MLLVCDLLSVWIGADDDDDRRSVSTALHDADHLCCALVLMMPYCWHVESYKLSFRREVQL